MHEILDWLTRLTDSKEVIMTGGLALVTLIVYAENGLFFAFFLPGDYLLFLTGVFGGTGVLAYPLWVLLACLFGAAVLGSLTGYLFGRFFGQRLENRPDSRFFKKQYLETTRSYFAKYGSKTLIISRFLPVVRTFAPILAGLIRMSRVQFLTFNIIGGALWVLTLVSGGYYFGVKVPQIVNYVHYIILFFLAVTSFTVVKGYLNARKDMRGKE
ncbi:MAG: VTT domain-containing protein [Spirosomataceae bacterium]